MTGFPQSLNRRTSPLSNRKKLGLGGVDDERIVGETFPDATISLTDLSEPMLNKAKERFLDATLTEAGDDRVVAFILRIRYCLQSLANELFGTVTHRTLSS